MRTNTKVFRIALCGIISAASVVILIISSIIPFSSYSTPALAGILCASAVIEAGNKYALCVYFSVSVISFLIVPDKEAVLLYTSFFGYYPIVKQLTESRIKNRILQITVKIFIFCAAACLFYFCAVAVLGIPSDEFNIGRINLPLLFLAAGIIVFIIFDYAFTSLITIYLNFIRKFIIKNDNNSHFF